MKTLVSVALGLALSACGASSVRPAPAVATAAFAVPSGDVQLTTSGVVDVGTQSASTQGVQALHLRMTLTNDSDEPWTVDTREQRIDLEGYGTSAPAFASSDAGSPPIVTIAPGEARDVDLYFPLPAALADEATLPVFDVLWDVHTAGGLLAQRTPFESVAVEQPQPGQPDDYAPQWGGGYWYNPEYAQHEFTGGVVIPPFYFGAPLYVHRHEHFGTFAPRGHYYAHGRERHENGVARPRGEDRDRHDQRDQRDQRDWVRGREEAQPRNETQRNERQRNETQRNETRRNEPQRNEPRRNEAPRAVTPHNAAPRAVTPHDAAPRNNPPARPVPRIEQRATTRPVQRAIPRPAPATPTTPTATPTQPQRGGGHGGRRK